MKRALVAFSLLAGCASASAYPFDGYGIAPPHAGYRIAYESPQHHQFVSDDWRVENYALDPFDDAPLFPAVTQAIHLQLAHRRTQATLWVRSVPIGAALEQTALRVLAERWVASTATRGHLAAGIAENGSVSFADERFATELLEARALGVHGQPAYAVLVDVTSLDRTERTYERRSSRALVTFVRLPHRAIRREGRARGEEPLLLIVGYSNDAEAFDESMPDYTRFLDAIEFVEDSE